MATIDFSLDSRVKKTYVPLISQQLHLRHLKRIAARNLKVSSDVTSGDDSIGYCFAIFNTAEELLYESETIFNTNPEWKTFQSSSFRGPAIRELIVRLFHCQTIVSDLCEDSGSRTQPKCYSSEPFIEWTIHLNGLVFIGEEIPKDNRFKENTLILGLMEGFYTSFDSIISDEVCNQLCLRRQSLQVSDITSCRNSYCLNVLYRIEMMQRVITQTQTLVNNTRTKLEEKLSKMLDKSDIKSRVELMEVKVKNLKTVLNESKERLNTCHEIKVKNESEICEKGIDLLNKIQNLKHQREKLSQKREWLAQTRERLTKTKALLMIKRKQMITDISNIYPLVPFPDGKGGYSICGVHLPNSEDLDGHDQTMISIAIGYVSHVLIMISRLLDVTLRYQIYYFGSNSSVVDHLNSNISHNDRVLALYTKGKDRLFFKYGVFLINKNIAQLRHYFGLQTRDLSATLHNLYSLLKERLVLLNEDSIPTISANNDVNNCSDSPNSSQFGQIDEHLRRELEVMRNQQELHSGSGGAGPSKDIRLRNLSIASTNPIRSENRNISRSLDKGLNEMVMRSSTKSSDGSVSSSHSSDTHFNAIPKHIMNSNQIHHNLSETDFKKMIERKQTKHMNNELKCCQTNQNRLFSGVNGNGAGSSHSSSPQSHVWTDSDVDYNEKHSENN